MMGPPSEDGKKVATGVNYLPIGFRAYQSLFEYNIFYALIFGHKIF